jgi:hypothetical protein
MRCQTCGFPASPVLYRCGNCNALLGPPPGAAAEPGTAAALAAADDAVAAFVRRRQPLVGLGVAAAVAIWLATGTFVLALMPIARGFALADGDLPGLRVALAALLISGLVAFVAWLIFIAWLFLARRNVDTFPEAMPNWGLSWTITAWFLPVVGAFIGPSVVADVAYNSADDFGVVERRRLAGAVWRWWTLYLIAVGALALIFVSPRLAAAFAVEIGGTGIWLSPGLIMLLTAIGCGIVAAAAISRVIVGVSSGTARRDERAAVAGHPWSTLGA